MTLLSLVGLGGPGYASVKDFFLYFKKKCKDVNKIEEYLGELKTKAGIVDDHRKDIEAEAKRYATTKELTCNGKDVVGRAKKFVEKVDEIKNKCTTEKSRKCNFFTIAKLSKKIRNEEEKAAELIKEMKEKGNLFTDKTPDPFVMMRAENISDIPFLEEKTKVLLDFLKDKDVRSVGIYGPPGIGITDILKNINNEFKRMHDQPPTHNHSLFDMSIWVTVGMEKSEISEIQKEIAQKLGIHVAVGDGNEQVARRISEALVEKRYLLILDEVCLFFELDRVGINTDQHKHGKVVIGASNKTVIKKMKPDEEIHVDTLQESDARNLFWKYVGNIVDDDDHIKFIAETIVRELGGLPQVIKTLGLHLKGESNEFEWITMRSALKSDIKTNVPELQELGGVYNAYKLIYDKLPLDGKKCVLYGALFSRDYKICKDYLVESWGAERFIHDSREGHNPLYSTTRENGLRTMQDLTGKYLLDWCSTKECVKDCVKMPVIFRKMALRFLEEEDDKVLVKAGEGIDELFVDEESWSDAKRVSLMCNELKSLSSRPKCSKMSTLLLQRNKSLTKIEDSFFSHMSELRILDLSHTGIEQLPLGVCRLRNLIVLYLIGCDGLASLPTEIKGLLNLEVLDTRGTAIQNLPIEIQDLVWLRCLKFSFPKNVDSTDSGVVPPNLVKNLGRLEELTIIVDDESEGWNTIAHRIAKEMASLRKLTTLYYCFPNIESLETFISERNPSERSESHFFRSFNFQIGYHQRQHSHGLDRCGNPPEQHLKLSIDDHTTSAVRDVLKMARTFELFGHKTIKNLSEFGMENVRMLEVCVIEECSEMVSVVADNVDDAFIYLQKLHISSLQSLKCIQNVPVEHRIIFSSLTVLTLKGCPELSKILTLGITPALVQLQHLWVENCQNIASVFEASVGEITSEEDTPLHTLPKLRILELVNLPSLVSICQNTTLDWLSLEKIQMRACGTLRHLSLTTTNARKLRLIKCNKDWWGELQLKPAVRERFEPFCRFFHEEDQSDNETAPGTSTGNGGGEPHDHLPDLSAISNHDLRSQ